MGSDQALNTAIDAECDPRYCNERENKEGWYRLYLELRKYTQAFASRASYVM